MDINTSYPKQSAPERLMMVFEATTLKELNNDVNLFLLENNIKPLSGTTTYGGLSSTGREPAYRRGEYHKYILTLIYEVL